MIYKLPIEKSKGPWKKGKKGYMSYPMTGDDVTEFVNKRNKEYASKKQEKEYIAEKKKDTQTKGNPYYKEKFNG
jgi:bisphosphoglycerate-dependent phosphoglycerate mutase